MKEEMRDRYGLFRKSLLALCLVTLAFGAWAQEEAAEEDTEAATEEEAADLGRIEVTGSLLKREEFTSTSPMQIINAETQAQVGQLSVADILQSTTVAAGTVQANNTFQGWLVQGGTGVQTLDLRGLGTARTLVLLNGRRPGGSGTRGQVNALDLSMIPEIAAQRFEIVLDGSSSIYGSDAVAGVANIITRRGVEGTELQALVEAPFEGGGERYRVAGITGMNFEKGAFTISGQYEKFEALRVKDRDFLECSEPLVTDANGNRIDREDRSITAGTPLSGCSNLYANTVIDYFITGGRLIPSPDGVTIGSLPGYRPRANGRYDDEGGQAFYEDVLNFDFHGSETARNEQERASVYATFDYAFDALGGIDWDVDFLYSQRKTTAEGWRQFFPLISSSLYIPYPDDPTWDPVPFLPASLPVMPYPSNSEIDVKFYYLTTGLEGLLPTKNYWSWQVYGAYSRSDGDYGRNSISVARSGDISRGATAPPSIDYFTPGILSGSDMDQLINAIGLDHTGNTIYDQFQLTAIVAGDLFSMPAGMVGTAFGIEYRDFSIDDQPSEASVSGDLWGESSALVTKGSNSVIEAFVEAEIPLIAGKPFFEDLTVNLSARAFDYDIGGNDWVWKAGLKWSFTPTIMARATAGTSYRAPALFELFLGDETGFVGQLGIDPCIDWGESDNSNIRTNCAADGIPEDYSGFPSSSATVISGGGAEFLEPETSDAMTLGLVWTPEFADFSIAVDYFDIEVNDQISQLGAGSIVNGCYFATNFPNSFCDLFTRAPPNDDQFPNNILEVRDTFVNVNTQRVKGYDMNLRWDHDFAAGNLVVEWLATYYLENVQQLFAPGEVEGFETTDYTGTTGNPDLVSNLRASFTRNDWTFNYYLQYISETSDAPDFLDEVDSYFGFEDARFDYTLDEVFYHNVSIFYSQDKWDLILGINNLLDEDPDTYSSGGFGRRGNVRQFATQYDWLGRRAFARLNFRF